MHCHQRNRRFVLVILVGIGDQRNLLQERRQGAIRILLLIIGHRILKLDNIIAPSQRFVGSFFNKCLDVATLLQDFARDIQQMNAILQLLLQLLNHGPKSLNPWNGWLWKGEFWTLSPRLRPYLRKDIPHGYTRGSTMVE